MSPMLLLPPPSSPRHRLPRPTLRPVDFGTQDPTLARAVLGWVRDATPPTVIPAHPLTQGRVRAFLTTLGL